MKRCWIGAGFLLVLLAGSLAVSWAMDKIHKPIEADLNRAAELAMEERWEDSGRCFRRALDHWERWDHFRTCFADHTPVEEVSAGFRALEVYGAAREETEFAARCRELAAKAAAVGEAHGLLWWNLF